MTDLQKNLVLTAVMGSVLCIVFLPTTWWLYPLFYFISYPWKFQGHINSLWGGVCADGGVGSLVCIYQDARDGDAVSIFTFGVQKSSRDAVSGGGIALFQEAKDCAHFGIGLMFRQYSGYFSRHLLGIVWEQHSLRDVKLYIGLVWSQKALGRYRGWGLAVHRCKQTASR